MITLIYKRTHNGDPDAETGTFGCHGCMGIVRGWIYGAVIGVGGVGQEPINELIAGRLTWIGIGPHRSGDLREPMVTFDHFWYRGPEGPMLEFEAPHLARRMYSGKVRVIKSDSLTAAELEDVERLLRKAMKALPSPGRGDSRPARDGSGRDGLPGKSRTPRRPCDMGCQSPAHRKC